MIGFIDVIESSASTQNVFVLDAPKSVQVFYILSALKCWIDSSDEFCLKAYILKYFCNFSRILMRAESFKEVWGT